MSAQITEAIQQFLDTWTEDPNHTKNAFTRFKQLLAGLDGVTLDFVARPGITFSLRATHANQTTRKLFAMVDVIDDDPADRWLSVCFYKDLVDDPDELADEVPEGLLGEDARCFDLYENEDELVSYIEARLKAACAAAAKG